MPSQTRASDDERSATGEQQDAIATTTSAASATRKPSAPPPLPSRRLAPPTTSLIDEAGDDGAEQRRAAAPSGARRAGSRRPGRSPRRASSSGRGRSRACRWCRRASRSRCRCRARSRKSTCENLTSPAARASIRHTSCMSEVPPAAAPAARPHQHQRPRALRRPLRRADRGDALLGDARPDGDHRAAGGDLARRRPARHLDLPAARASPRR